ncbi:MAG: hypothetical protein AAF743_10845, partial [Planctomycetota bacterium]
LGPTLDTTATVLRVTAELWRARPGIENFDTCSLRVGLGRGDVTLDLVVIYTHAGRTTQHPQLDIDTDRGTLSITFDGNATFTTHAGETRSANQVDDLSCRPPMARALGAAVLGEEPDVAVATLATSRAHSVLVSAVSEAAAIVDVPDDCKRVVEADGDTHVEVDGLDDAINRAAAARRTLGETDTTLPAQPGKLEGLADYAHFAGPKGFSS